MVKLLSRSPIHRCALYAPPIAIALLLVTPAPAGALFGCGINPLCLVGKGVGGAVSSVAGDAITALAKAVLGALGHAVEWASTLWVGIGTPPIADAAGQPTGTVAFLQQNLLVYTTGLAVLCTLLGAGRIAWQEHKAAQMRDLGRYLVTYVLISSAAAGAASVLIGGSDQMASWFISRATGSSNFADHLASLLGLAAAGTSQAAGAPAGFTVGLAGTVTTAFIAIVLGIIAFLATVVQIMLMLVRGGMLVLLVGTLPLVAAFSNTEMGMQWLRKASAWLIAFALYKPAAAIVYAVAFDLGGQQGALALLDGVMMLVLAILTLPALLRFVVPATSALAGGGGAGGVLAGAAGGATALRMPTGAAAVAQAPASAYAQGQGGGPSGAALAGAGPGAGGAMNGSAGAPGASPQNGQAGGSGQNGQAGGSGQNGQAGGSGQNGQPGASGSAGSAAPSSMPDAGGASGAGGAGAGSAGGAGASSGAGSAGCGAAGGAAAAGAVVQAYSAGKRAASAAVEPGNSGDGAGGPTGASENPS